MRGCESTEQSDNFSMFRSQVSPSIPINQSTNQPITQRYPFVVTTPRPDHDELPISK